MGIFGGGDERQASIARIRGRLEDDLRPDTKADSALGAELLLSRQQTLRSRSSEANDFRAAAEAENCPSRLHNQRTWCNGR